MGEIEEFKVSPFLRSPSTFFQQAMKRGKPTCVPTTGVSNGTILSGRWRGGQCSVVNPSFS